MTAIICQRTYLKSKLERRNAALGFEGKHIWMGILILILNSVLLECCRASVQDYSQVPPIANQDAIFFVARNDCSNRSQDNSYIIKFSQTSGQFCWKRNITDIAGITNNASVTAIAVSEDTERLAFAASDVDKRESSTTTLLGIIRTSDGQDKKKLARMNQFGQQIVKSLAFAQFDDDSDEQIFMTLQSVGEDSHEYSEGQASLKIVAVDLESSKVKWVRQFDQFVGQTMNAFRLSKGEDDLIKGLYIGGSYELHSDENNEGMRNYPKKRATIFHMQGSQKEAILYAFESWSEESQNQVQAIDQIRKYDEQDESWLYGTCKLNTNDASQTQICLWRLQLVASPNRLITSSASIHLARQTGSTGLAASMSPVFSDGREVHFVWIEKETNSMHYMTYDWHSASSKSLQIDHGLNITPIQAIFSQGTTNESMLVPESYYLAKSEGQELELVRLRISEVSQDQWAQQSRFQRQELEIVEYHYPESAQFKAQSQMIKNQKLLNQSDQESLKLRELQTEESEIDPCLDPLSLKLNEQSASLVNQEYTIGEDARTYQIDELFVADPVECAVSYSLKRSVASAVDFDAESRTFTFFNEDDLSLSGPTFKNYKIIVSGSVGTKQIDARFKLRLKKKDFCLDSTIVSILVPSLQGQTYTLHAEELKWQHEEFKVSVQSQSDADVCGGVSYEVIFREEVQTLDSRPLSYDNTDRKLSFFSNDYNDIGRQQFTIEAYLTEYPSIKVTIDATLKVGSSCPGANQITATDQGESPEPFYYYFAENFKFEMVPFFALPTHCPVFYTCKMIEGPTNEDLCRNFGREESKLEQTSYAAFSSSSGNYEFATDNIDRFPPGTYTFRVTGTITEDFYASIVFEMVLIDPCTYAPTIELPLKNRFRDMTYNLGDPPQSQTFFAIEISSNYLPRRNLQSKYTKQLPFFLKTDLKCGPVKVKFSNNDQDRTPLDPELFFVGESVGLEQVFRVKSTVDTSLAGSYQIICALYFEQYPEAYIDFTPFTVNVVNQCNLAPEKSVEASVLEDQEYTIGEEALEYRIPAFAFEPSDICQIVYSFEIINSQGEIISTMDSDSGIFTFDSESHIFTVESSTDLSLAGEISSDYTVLVKGEIGTTESSVADSASFNLKVINPCILMVPEQDAPPEYFYTGTRPQLEFTPEAVEVYPPFCPLSFECKILSGPRLDLCDVNEANSVGKFDETTGQFKFQSRDNSSFLPGLYVMQITTSSSFNKQVFDIDLNLVFQDDREAPVEDFREDREAPVDEFREDREAPVDEFREDREAPVEVFGPRPQWLDQLQDQFVIVGESLALTLGPKASETEQLPESISLRLSSKIERFTYFNTTENTLFVQGSATTQNDVGVWEIPMTVIYREEQFYQVFRSQVILHVHFDQDMDTSEETNQLQGQNMLNLDDFQGLVIRELPEQTEDNPLPYALAMSPESIIEIAWDQPMVKMIDASLLRSAKVACDYDVFNEHLSQANRRRLEGEDDGIMSYTREEAWSDDPQSGGMINVVILDAIEVKLVREVEGEVRDTKRIVDWEVADYTSDFIQLKLNFESPEELGSQLDVKDYLSINFWGLDYFVSQKGVKVKFGQETRSHNILRLSDQESIEVIDGIGAIVNGTLLVTMAFAMIILIAGRLLPTWMYINSLQLIVYTPLVTTIMPANLHYFLNNYLQIVRFNIDQVKAFLLDYEWIEDEALTVGSSDEESYLTPLLRICGYRGAISGNLIAILALFIALLALVLIIGLLAKARKKKANVMARICNFSLRYFYEFFLELCLSMSILAATLDGFNSAAWIPVLLTFAATAALVVFLISRFFGRGPYVSKSYKPGTLISSYWSIRPLADSQIATDLIQAKMKQIKNENENKPITLRKTGAAQNDSKESEQDFVDVASPAQTEVHHGRRSTLADLINPHNESPEKSNERLSEFREAECPAQTDERLMEFREAECPAQTDERLQERRKEDCKEQVPEPKDQEDFMNRDKFYQIKASIRLQLESKAYSSPYYCTLYYGLRRNHEHNAATVYPLLFVLRRIIYSLVIVFMIDGNKPFVGAMILNLTCLIMLIFVAVEGQWDSWILNMQDFVNELAFYIMCVGLICFTDVLTDTQQSLTLGWIMIGLVLVIMTFNSGLICHDMVNFLRLLYLRCKNRASRKRQIRKRNQQVAPVDLKPDDAVTENFQPDDDAGTDSEKYSSDLSDIVQELNQNILLKDYQTEVDQKIHTAAIMTKSFFQPEKQSFFEPDGFTVRSGRFDTKRDSVIDIDDLIEEENDKRDEQQFQFLSYLNDQKITPIALNQKHKNDKIAFPQKTLELAEGFRLVGRDSFCSQQMIGECRTGLTPSHSRNDQNIPFNPQDNPKPGTKVTADGLPDGLEKNIFYTANSQQKVTPDGLPDGLENNIFYTTNSQQDTSEKVKPGSVCHEFGKGKNEGRKVSRQNTVTPGLTRYMPADFTQKTTDRRIKQMDSLILPPKATKTKRAFESTPGEPGQEGNTATPFDIFSARIGAGTQGGTDNRQTLKKSKTQFKL